MNRYTIHTQQEAAIVREFIVEADCESRARERMQEMIASGDFIDPSYTATETCGKVQIIDVYKL